MHRPHKDDLPPLADRRTAQESSGGIPIQRADDDDTAAHPNAGASTQDTIAAATLQPYYMRDLALALRNIPSGGETGASAEGTEEQAAAAETLPKLLFPKEVWVDFIFPFLGPGQFFYVGTVCHDLRKLYLEYHSTAERDLIYGSHLIQYPLEDVPQWKKQWKTLADLANFTYFSAAFSNMERATQFPLLHDKGLCDKVVCRTASMVGNLGVLKWARQEGFSWDQHTCMLAAKNGHLHILQWARAQDPPCPWDAETCGWAAKNGHLEMLKWARSQDPPCPWHNWTVFNAAKEGQLEILQWAFAQEHPPCQWDDPSMPILCQQAAAYGHLHILQWALAQDPPAPLDEDICRWAGGCGQLKTLQWLRGRDPPCPWDQEMLYSAAEKGHLEVLQWARAQDPPCPWNDHAMRFVCTEAARLGHLQMLQWARAQDPPCPWDEETLSMAMEDENEHWEMLQWARAQDPPCPWSHSTFKHVCSQAAIRGDLKVLQWARSLDPPCPWDRVTLGHAAYYGHWEILLWARAQDPPCPWHENVFFEAVDAGNLDIAQWLFDNGCPWDNESWEDYVQQKQLIEE